MRKARVLTFTAVMAALANVLSLPLFALPLQIGSFTSAVHFFQVAIFLCGILAGPWAGLLGGAVGGLYMSFTKIPFVMGGIAILGGSAGVFSRKFRPVSSGLLAWVVQAPYVLITDYIWFTIFVGMSSAVALSTVTSMMINLTLQAVVCAILANLIAHYIKRAGISL